MHRFLSPAILRRTLLLITLAILVLMMPGIIVNADRQSYTCPTTGPIVCLSKGTSTDTTCSTATRPRVVLAVKTGCLIPDQEMSFKMFGVYANNTILFDTTSLWGPLGYPENIMVFQAQAYGNGSMDIRIIGPRAVAVKADASVDLYNTGAWGQGPEIVYNGVTSPTSLLTVQWIPVGGTCFPVCIFGSQTLGIVIPFLVVLVSVVLAVVFRERKRIRTELSLIGY